MSEPTKPAEEGKDEIGRGVANLVLLGVFLIIIGIGVWLVFALDTARRADDCLARGGRHCTRIIEVPPR